MASRRLGSSLARAWFKGMTALTRQAQRASRARHPAPAIGDWLPGMALRPGGARRYWLFRPPGLGLAERVPLVVMLHGCGQDAESFARSTRMNRLAARQRCLVLYPEQDRLANPQGCWNWFGTRNGGAQAEADLILAAIDQACLLYRGDPNRVALVGLSAGASMAALLASQHPQRFRAVVMHSGIPPGTASSPVTAIGAMQGRRGTAAAAASGPAWPPLLVIHGTADRVVVPSNGAAATDLWVDQASVQATAQTTRTVQRGRRRPSQVTDYRLGRRLVATRVMVDGLGHAWSGGAAGQPFSDPLGPDASRMALVFINRQFALAGGQPLRAASAGKTARPQARDQLLPKPKPKAKPKAKPKLNQKPKLWPFV